MTRLTARTSTILITSGAKTRVYRSVSEVPASLRRKLQETTNGANSATILIADRRGREELIRALQGLPSEVESRLANNIRARQSKSRPRVARKATLRIWLELLLPVSIGVLLWFFIDWHF